jgi:small nuclear ribonucleoprotein (snRNP)-like protein
VTHGSALVRRLVTPLVVLALAGNVALDGKPPQQRTISQSEAARVRAKVGSLPLGTRVNVTLFDYKTLGGTLKSVDDNGFTVMTTRKAPAERRFRFEEVRAVKRPSRIPTAGWVAIIAGGALIIFAIWFHQVDKNT